jgi:hypothetical protein
MTQNGTLDPFSFHSHHVEIMFMDNMQSTIAFSFVDPLGTFLILSVRIATEGQFYHRRRNETISLAGHSTGHFAGHPILVVSQIMITKQCFTHNK